MYTLAGHRGHVLTSVPSHSAPAPETAFSAILGAVPGELVCKQPLPLL